MGSPWLLMLGLGPHNSFGLYLLMASLPHAGPNQDPGNIMPTGWMGDA